MQETNSDSKGEEKLLDEGMQTPEQPVDDLESSGSSQIKGTSVRAGCTTLRTTDNLVTIHVMPHISLKLNTLQLLWSVGVHPVSVASYHPTPLNGNISSIHTAVSGCWRPWSKVTGEGYCSKALFKATGFGSLLYLQKHLEVVVREFLLHSL